MTFAAMQERLLEVVRTRIRNGEMSERRLARLSGISQPHMHNILKGVRLLPVRIADEILRQLRINAADLVGAESTLEDRYRPVPILLGTLGPEMHDFQPDRTAGNAYLPMQIVQGVHKPLAAGLGEDPEIAPQFQPGDLILIDQSPELRTEFNANAAYLVMTSRGPRIRFVRQGHSRLYLSPAPAARHPSQWEAALDPVLDVVRGRVIWLSRRFVT